MIPSDESEAERDRIIAKGGMRCFGCNAIVDPNDPNTMREIHGWDRPRAAGGQNHVWFREETGRLMCATCSLRRRHTGQTAQDSLLA